LTIPATSKDHPESQISFVHRHSPLVGEVIRRALFNKMHVYALLTATAAHMRHMSMHSLPAKNNAEVFMQKAIACLRVYLKSCADPKNKSS